MSLRPPVAFSATLRYRPRRMPRCYVAIRSLSQQHPSLDAPGSHYSQPTRFSSSVLQSVDPQRTGGGSSNTEGPGELSDQEWEIRTGRAIYVLQQTLPTFFSTGLISSVDTSGSNSRTKEEDEISIYSPNIRLEYRPPTPFPRTLHVEGLPLYLASSSFVRHTLNALYTDLRVELQRVRVHGPRSPSSLHPDGHTPGADLPDDIPRPQQQQGKTRSIRDKSLFVGLAVRGTNRVSKAEGGWEVNSTYTFSPITGLIHIHNIDSIHPAPHQAFFNALQAALNKLGLGGPHGATGAGGVARSSPPSCPQPVPPTAGHP